MQTLYLDVYILIDFTVDMLSFYFASRLTHVPIRMLRICFAAVFGTTVSLCLTLFDAPIWIVVICTVASFLIALPIAVGKIGQFRALRFLCAFLIIEMFLGGAVTLMFQILDSLIEEKSAEDISNRNLIIVAITILLLYGSLKTLMAVFSETANEKTVKVTIEIFGRKEETVALVDSGNLAVDPMDLRPVMLLTENAWHRITGISDIQKALENSAGMKKAFRLIPIRKQEKTEMYYALRPDGVFIEKKGKAEPIAVIIALDTNRRDYGGYEALIPFAALS